MRLIKAIIFDCDGVLVDTMPLHFKTWQLLANQWGATLSENIIAELRGSERNKSLEIVLKAIGMNASEEDRLLYAKVKDDYFQQEIKNMDSSILIPGIVSLLEYLSKQNLKLAVASSSRNARIILEQIQLGSYFDYILDANDVVLGKPDPAIFIETINMLNVLPNQVLVIEDSPLGIEAAIEAGCHCLGLGDTNYLHQATMVFDSIEKLQKYIETWKT